VTRAPLIVATSGAIVVVGASVVTGTAVVVGASVVVGAAVVASVVAGAIVVDGAIDVATDEERGPQAAIDETATTAAIARVRRFTAQTNDVVLSRVTIFFV
jgi:hypothetical protein